MKYFFRIESRDCFAERTETTPSYPVTFRHWITLTKTSLKLSSDGKPLDKHPFIFAFKKHLAVSVLCSLFSVLFLLSCNDKNYISNQSQSVADGAWKYEDTKDYAFDIADTSKVYNIYLALNHAEDYAYQNLYLKIHTQFPSGKTMEQQVSFELADKYGKWYGDCGSKCELLVDLQKGAYFNEVGKHTITLEQFMRRDPIQGINELSVMVKETEVNR